MSKKAINGPRKLKKVAGSSTTFTTVPTVKKPNLNVVESTIQETQLTALERTANEVFKNKVPDYVMDLLPLLVFDDSSAIWEMNTFVDDKGNVIDPDNLRTYVDEMRLEREKNIPNPNERLAIQNALSFLSPALSEEKKADLQRDILLLQKPLYVRGPIKCQKCNDNYIATIQLTVRSFDEPSINIFICGTCYYSWSSQ